MTSQPSFGAERRGAPITASTRLAHEPIRVLNQVSEPDIVVVLDDSLLQVGGAAAGVKPGGLLIVNTTRPAADLPLSGDFDVVTADVTGAAEAVDLIVGGQPMVSTAILGSFAAATGLIDLDSVEQAIGHVFTGKAATKNIEAARIAFECTH